MATDNVTLNAGTGGATYRSLADASSVEWAASVVCYATTVSAGANVLQVVTASAGLPVAQQGTWAVTSNAGTNLNTSALALETGGNLASLATKTPALGQALAAASTPVVLTAAQLATLTPLSTVPVTGTFYQTTQPVSGTFWQATQPVSGTLAATQSGTWNVATVTTVSAVTAITNALPAGANSIGTVQLGNTANTTPILANRHDPAAGTGSITAVDAAVSTATGQGGQSILTGTPTAGSSVSVTLSGHTTVNLQVSGTWVGTLTFERSIDGGTTYYPASMLLHGVGGSALATITANCALRTNCGGSTTFRVRCTAYSSGTASITFQPCFGDALIASTLEAGSNLLGQASIANQVGVVYNGTTAVSTAVVPISTAAVNNTPLVSGVSGKRVYVLRWSGVAAGTVGVNLQSHTTTSNATGVRPLIANETAGGSWCPGAIFITTLNEGLDINLSAAIGFYGELTYCQF